MRLHSEDSRLFLVELSDFTEGPPAPRVAENLDALRPVLDWAKAYLCNPHPQLGRAGPVCPFTPPSIRKELFFLAVWRGAELDGEEVVEVVRLYRDWFLELEPRDGRDAQYKSINILFPDLPREAWSTLIEATQERLKPEYVPHGIMIGEFHPGPPEKESLWNPDFRPLKSPLPLLSIRNMVPTDFAFLKGRKDFMQAYLRLHGDNLPLKMADEVHRVAAAFGLAVPAPSVAIPVPASVVEQARPVRVAEPAG
ncbi:MAG TPA: hypothetical protein VHG08_19870 [Longimicrobium sp.]|nr:hypothetical protein [Longimicrobium sp.]